MEWISVEDKLPTKYQKVVIADIFKGEVYDFAAAMYFGDKYFVAETEGLEASNYDGGACISLNMQITHWLPLPAPPKDEQ